jgi:hypothetical protein
LCTGYYSSRSIPLERMLPDAVHCMLHAPIYALKYAPACTRLHTTSLLDCRLLNKLSRRAQVHSRARSQIHSQLHSMTLPACLTIHSHVRSQDAHRNTSEYAPKYISESLSSTLLIALDDRLPAYLALRSYIHSAEPRHSQSHLTICSNVCSCMLGPETC